ncbi:hypothetical protein SKAU_G00390830 [Synaphobranchus kaupii]|uniref:ALMS motif domain-containing protein n=1 Tax=Synaphobranchus kaupii TaxID=118154 RepID=A0A9Q1EBH9_SYNKA|nr:hypothetical protein SKAU_G00390830 [Synaphobranchus kaupii]
MEPVEVQDEEAVIRPIVTTPPISRQGRADELRSVSSSPGSGTHISSSTSAVSLGEAIAHRAKQGVESWGQLPMEANVSQLTMASVSRLGQTSSWRVEVDTQNDANEEGLVTVAEEDIVQQPEGRSCSFQLGFQDSHLSPALPLLPDKSGQLLSLAEDTLFHQTDLEFVALRGSPDISVASERFPLPHQVSDASQICSSKVSVDLLADRSVLLQNPLGLTVASVEEASCCSLSQHTLSPFSEDGEQDGEYLRGTLEEMQAEREPCYGVADQPTHTSDTSTRPQEKPMKALSKVSSTYQSGDVTVPLLLELPQRDVRLSSSSSVVSSASETSMNKGSSSRGSTGYKAVKPEAAPSSRQEEITEQKKGQQEEAAGPKLDHSRSSLEREPSAQYREASCSSPTQMKTSTRTGDLDTSGRSEVSNITTRFSHAQRDDDSDALREQLCSEIETARQSKARPKPQEPESHPKPLSSQSVTPNTCSLGTHSGKGSTIIEVPTDFDKTEGRLTPGFSFERGHTERELSSSGNQMAVDRSFLGSFSQPVSHSTPGVFSGPPRASVQPPIGKLSPIESNPEVSQSSSRVAQSSSSKPFLAPMFDISVRDRSGPGSGTGPLRDGSLKSTGKIQSLPSLNFMEKVGAWNTNQNSGKTFFDNLALRGFSGVSPKKKAFDAISDSLNRMLSQEASSKQFVEASASGPSIHSPRRKLAASFSGTTSVGTHSGGVSLAASPLDRPENQPTLCTDTGELQPSDTPGNDLASPESSCLSVISKTGPPQRDPGQNEHDSGHQLDRTEPAGEQEVAADKDKSGAGRGSAEEPESEAQPTTRLCLDRFSDVSSNRDLSNTLTCSQDSYHFERRLAASMGAVSSVVSLEVDNYVPYWNPSPSSPAKDAELNIEERIPMYLHNLGIDQSPSAILTPFVPRGPIREPEFSLKGSTGTPTKSTQPSEEGSPPKAEFSRCSLLSVGSSVSIPLSVDSLQPTIPLSQHTKDRPLNERCLQTAFHPLSPLPQDSPQPPGPDTAHNLSDSTDDPTALRVRELIEKFQSGKVFVTPDSLSSSEARQQQARDSPLEAKPSSETSNGSTDQGADSFVGSKTLQEIRKLLGRAESIVSEKSSISSSPTSTDDSLLCLKRKLEGFQDSFASSAGNQEMSSSLLWGRSSSESALMSDGMKGSSSSKLCRSPQASGHNFAQSKSVLLRSLDSISNQAAESFPTKSVRRSEPEGCSASAPDRAAPVFVSVIQVNPPTPSGGVPQGPAQEVISPTESLVSGQAENMQAPSLTEAERAVESDSSSADTLTIRVAALLRNESPATMASSNGSTASEEDRKAREWIKLTVSGQQCEQLQLNAEDRQRIEEIKRDLLHNTKHLTKSQLSTDTDSSTHSSAPWERPPSHAGRFNALKTAEHQLSHQLQRLNRNAFDSSVHLHSPVRQDLEARVRDVAQRISPPPITSITIASCRRSPSPAPPRSPTPSPLDLAHLAADSAPLPATGGHTSESQEPALRPKVDMTVQVSLEAESVGGTENVAHIGSPPSGLVPASGLGSDRPDESPSSSDAIGQSRQDTLGTQYSTSNGFDTSSTAGEGSRTGGRRAGTPFHLDPTSYRQVSRSDPNISSSSSLEPSAALVRNSTFASGSCSIVSPTRNVLSHVHLTLSPKQPNGKPEGSVRQDRSPERNVGGTESRTGLPPDFSTRLTSLNPPEFSVRGHLFPDGHPPVNRSSYFPVPRVTSCTNVRQEPVSAPLLLDRASSQEVPIQPIGRRNRETADASVQITTRAPQRVSWRAKPFTSFPQSFTAQSRVPGLSEPLAIQTPAAPILLPYKPHGSPELFYIPKSEAQPSPIQSNTTEESSHPGSDDAVPPKFASDVLGSRDQEEGAAVSARHAEGIYSKRLPGHRARQGHGGHRMGTIGGLQANEVQQSRRPYPLSLRTGDSGDPPRVSDAWQNVRGVDPPSRDQEEEEEFAPLQEEETSSTENLRPYSRSVRDSRPLGGSDVEEPVHNWRDFTVRGVSSQGSGSNLNELWQRFNERRSQREAGPPGEGETPLLERLERLSRLIHSSRDATPLGARVASAPSKRREEQRSRQGEKEEKRREEEAEGGGQREADRRRGNRERSVQEAWAEQEEESLSSSTLTESSFGQHRCPAEKDGSGSRSGETDGGDTASTMSTVDTARLIRAFGPGRVQVNPGLNRLYSAIGRQKESTEEKRGRKRASPKPPAPAPSETNSTDDSTISTVAPGETASSDGGLRRGPSDIPAKKAVKLVNKGIQTGDLEIVMNGTRKHTRDVGTTFPSPMSAREAGHSSASGGGGQGEARSSPKTQSFMNEKRSRKAQVQHYPQGVSWFVPAESLKANTKENQPGPRALPEQGPVWFQPYTKTKPWREPLRERQIQEEPAAKLLPPWLALHFRRPWRCGGRTSCRARGERMKRLELQVEERRLQAVFEQEREQLFNQPGRNRQLSQPADFALHRKRVVPRKEMFKRSKQLSNHEKKELRSETVASQRKAKRIYSQLPEVQQRMEEERRKAEYCSYRLKAQLYKKKITNHVLGRKTPWQ